MEIPTFLTCDGRKEGAVSLPQKMARRSYPPILAIELWLIYFLPDAAEAERNGTADIASTSDAADGGGRTSASVRPRRRWRMQQINIDGVLLPPSSRRGRGASRSAALPSGRFFWKKRGKSEFSPEMASVPQTPLNEQRDSTHKKPASWPETGNRLLGQILR